MMQTRYKKKACGRTLACLVIFAWLGGIPVQSLAFDKFLFIDGTGGSADSRHRGWTDVVSYSQTFTLPDPKSKQAQCTSLVTTIVDGTSPLLWTTTINGGVIPKAILEFFIPSKAGSGLQFRATLENIKIKSVVNNGEAARELNMETLTLLPGMMKLEVFTLDVSGNDLPPITAQVFCP